MYRAISMICALRPTFMKSTPGGWSRENFPKLTNYIKLLLSMKIYLDHHPNLIYLTILHTLVY